jgi:hypothetical protein
MLNAITQQVRIVLIPPFNIHLFESVNYYFIVLLCISDSKLKTPSQRNAPYPTIITQIGLWRAGSYQFQFTCYTCFLSPATRLDIRPPK